MVTIQMNANWMTANPQLIGTVTNPKHFCIQLAVSNVSTYVFYSPSSDISASDPTSPARRGGPAMLPLYPYETVSIENEVFYALVQSAITGGSTAFVSNLLRLVGKGVIDIAQDGGAPFTEKQIIEYTAP